MDILTSVIARAGGGGSSSGGGAVIALIGYVPMHFLGAMSKHHIPVVIASMIMWPIAIIYAILLILLLRVFGMIAAVGAILGTGAGLYGWFDKILKLNKKAELDLQKAQLTDPAWDETKLLDHAQKVFMQYQQDWSNNNASSMSNYMTPPYAYHAQLMIYALQQLKRQDNVIQPTVINKKIVGINNAADPNQDSYTVYFQATADDQLIDKTNNTLLYRDITPFSEFWRFDRTDDKWLLADVQQATENGYMHNNDLESFVATQGYCFSPDWGWLLLPQRGQLFGKANFGKSDINNHVIGVYKNVLVQIYSYIPVKAQETISNYLIAQSTLPKSYGNIVVRKKRRLPFSRVKGLNRITLEWTEFNNRYEVWASDVEQVTSFELLNPSYMVKLQELPFEVNIEVVDNIVYLYSAKVPSNSANNALMLKILFEAFQEMKM